MSANGKMTGWIDGNLFNINRNKVPLAELQKYAGQWVAWAADGSQIVASHPDPLALCSIIEQAGLKSDEVVYSQIHADEVGLA
jgi:hypothetical protein